MQLKQSKYISLLAGLLLFTIACKKEDYAIPGANSALSNDCIKRTLGPNIIGQNIEFAYAMAIPPEKGKLVSAQVEASIAGARGTFLEHNSYFTKPNGQDTGVVVGQPSTTDGTKTTVTFNRDTSAATLRYYYFIPEEARGKPVSFTFTAKSSDGATVTYKMGPYMVSKMDMVRNLTVKNNDTSYISIADMMIYTRANVAANAARIDLIYLYRSTPATFLHALVSPAADAQYLPNVTLPAGVNRSTKIRKVFNLQDYNLARLQFGIYVDDLDFQKLNLADAPNFAINMKGEAGAWIETADGRYRAYIYINSANENGSAVISMKRYDMQTK
ncbi:MAG: DUF4466 family protein [Chitinophagaceae bacterium]